MLMEMERLNMQLKEEQNRVLTLQNELKFGTANNRKLIEVCINIGCIQNYTKLTLNAYRFEKYLVVKEIWTL